MMTSSKPNFLSFTIFFLLISSCEISLHPKQILAEESFTMYMIHRDSPKSPLYDNTTTHFQRIHNALLRSKQQVKYLIHNNASTINHDPEPLLRVHDQGEYVMQYSLGAAIFTQCLPSISSYDQGLLAYLNTDIFRNLVPVFYETLMCYEVVRESASDFHSDEETCQCKYIIRYGGGGKTTGHVFYTLLRLQTRLGKYVGFPMFIFGCSREVSGTFSTIASGIVGFGRAAGSSVSNIY